MSKSFFKEFYKYFNVSESSNKGWFNLEREKYKNIDIELRKRERDKNVDKSVTAKERCLYPVRLRWHLKRFLYAYTKASEILDISRETKTKQLEELETLCDALVEINDLLSCAKRGKAFEKLYSVFFSSPQFFDFHHVLDEMNEDLRRTKKILKLSEKDKFKAVQLYKIRANDKYELYDEYGMCHIPLELTHLTKNERFSISGLPSLYLGSSVYGSWVETDCPRIETANIALFEPKLDVRFLDLCWPDEFEPFEFEKIKQIPLILACDIPVKYPESTFKAEYSIPQLVLEAMVKYREEHEKNNLLGIRYTSVKRKTMNLSFDYKKYRRLYINYVFPPINIEKKEVGLCSVVQENIPFVKVTSSFHMINIDREMPVIKCFNDSYECSLFYRIEHHLKNNGMLVY